MSTSEISLTAGIRSNLLLLQNTQRQMEKTQNALSTGNKINTALDGPAAFFAAKGLNQRASDLMALKESMGQAINTIKAADTGVTAIEGLIEQMRGLTTQAYNALASDPDSVLVRGNLARNFDELKAQIDRVAQDAGYQGKNLLLGEGVWLDAISSTKDDINSVDGISSARTTNVSETDSYTIALSGTRAVSGNSSDIATAELDRGLTALKLSGTMSTTLGNFDDVTIELRGTPGRERSVTISEGLTSHTVDGFFMDDQTAVAKLTQTATATLAQVGTVTIGGTFEAGDTFTVTWGDKTATYTLSAGDVSAGASTADTMTAIKAALSGGLALGAGGALTITGYDIKISGATSGEELTFTSQAENAKTKDVTYTFASGTHVSFTLDREAMETATKGGNGLSVIEKNVNMQIRVTNQDGIAVERDASNLRGQSKLSAGVNAFAFHSGTVRLTIDERTIASSVGSTEVLITEQKTEADDANDLTVFFNETSTSQITVVSQNVQTDGRGLRLDYAQNDWADRSDIDEAVAQINFAVSELRSASTSLGTNLNIITTRETFTREFTNVLKEGADKLVLADQNEEGAKMLMLQTRQQLGTISLSLANQAQQAILQLF